MHRTVRLKFILNHESVFKVSILYFDVCCTFIINRTTEQLLIRRWKVYSYTYRSDKKSIFSFFVWYNDVPLKKIGEINSLFKFLSCSSKQGFHNVIICFSSLSIVYKDMRTRVPVYVSPFFFFTYTSKACNVT